ncbi:hypothetical protein KR038_000661 [Drosophila bunnanda]|nr:hypothetical protein KR038_000661 [Drosophila bunnanda]
MKTALEHRDRSSCAEQEKIQSLKLEIDVLKKINSSLKDEQKKKDNELSKAKKTFDEEVYLTNNLKNKILGLQEDLKQKEIKLIALEHEKNGIIEQLKNKMNTICNTIEQPIIASKMASSQEQPNKTTKRVQRKSQEVKPTVAVVGSPARSAKKRKVRKLDYSPNDSDFESEDDAVPIKMLISKRENLAVVKPQNDVFDALKDGAI